MDTWEKRHAAAQRYVDTARRAIDHQRSIIASQTALRLNSQASHDLLAVIERSQEIFESTLARLQAEREREQSAMIFPHAGTSVTINAWFVRAAIDPEKAMATEEMLCQPELTRRCTLRSSGSAGCYAFAPARVKVMRWR
jgi:hypothetical protein